MSQTKAPHIGEQREVRLTEQHASFAPQYVHQAYGMNLCWANALEAVRRPDGRRLPGSSRRVLEVLLGAEARKKGPASQLGIVRLSGMPRSTVQNGLEALEECGLVSRSPKGWILKTHRRSPKKTEAPPCRKSAAVNGEVPSPQNPLKALREGVARRPSKSAMWAKALLDAGWSKGGAWSTARKMERAFVPGAVETAHELAKAGKGRDPRALASWLLTDEWRRVERRMNRARIMQARMTGNGIVWPNDLSNAEQVWRTLQSEPISADNPGFLDHLDLVNAAMRNLVTLAEKVLGDRLPDRDELAARIRGAGIVPGGYVWNRAFETAWCRSVLETAGIRPC